MQISVPTSKVLDRPNTTYGHKDQSRNSDVSTQDLQVKYDLLNSVLQKYKLENLRNNESKNLSLWDKFRHEFTSEKNENLQKFRNNFTMTLNYIGVAMNAVAAIGSNKKLFPAEVAKFFDEKAEWFSRYIIPLGFGWNAVEALVGNRLIEFTSRMIPAVSFWFLPFYNFNFTTGISSGINYLLELVESRHGGLQPGKTMYENLIETSKTSYAIFKDIFTFNQSKEKFTEQLATVFLLLGSIGGFAFARKDRDSIPAILFGNMRNIGGLVADKDLIFNNETDPARRRDKQIVGTSCITASLLNILMRWVGPEMARALTHITTAADDFGLTYWAQSSKRANDAVKKNGHSKALHLAV